MEIVKKNPTHVSRREVLLVSTLARHQRLLRLALQSPKAAAVFESITKRFQLKALSGAMGIWHQYTETQRKYFEGIVMVRDGDGNIKAIQKVVRKCMTKKPERHHSPYSNPDEAALAIQCLFRGYMARGQALLMERNKLLKFIRSWSNHRTPTLFHMSALQEVEAQALIYTAIEFTCVPSRPIRNLPSLPQIQRYRAGLVALYWQVNHRRAAKKAERASERHERRMMHYEDLYAKVRERRDLARIEADRERQQQLEDYYRRQEEELERRRQYDSHMLILEMNNKKAAQLREVREAAWRELIHAKLVQEELEKLAQQQQQCEWEIMKSEDGTVRVLVIAQEAERLAAEKLRLEAAQVLNTKQLQWQADLVLCRRGRPTIYTHHYLYQKIRTKHEEYYQRWAEFVQSLPLEASYQQELVQIPRQLREELIEEHLSNMLKESSYSYRGVDGYLAKLFPLKENPRERQRQLRSFFVWSTARADHPWNGLIVPKRLIPVMTGTVRSILMYLKRDIPCEKMVTVPVIARLSFDPNSLIQLERVLQYQFLHNEYHEIHRSISINMSTFIALHDEIQSIRRVMKEERQLRSERKNLLAQAAVIEKRLVSLREELVRCSLRLYDVIFYLMKLCVELFCVNTDVDDGESLSSQEGPVSNPFLSFLSSDEQIMATPSSNTPTASSTTKSSKTRNKGEKSGRGKKVGRSGDSKKAAPDASSAAPAGPAVLPLYSSTRNVSSPLINTQRRGRRGEKNKRLDPNERVFDPHNDDCTLYWQQLIYLLTFVTKGRWTVSTLEMASWPTPPAPSHKHTGERVVLKDLPKKPPSAPPTSPSKRKLSMTVRQQALIAYLKKKSEEKVKKPRMKFHDIPGLNLFLEDRTAFDFLAFASEMASWAKGCMDYIAAKEKLWREDKVVYAFIAARRMDYLIDAPAAMSHQRNDSPYHRPCTAQDSAELLHRIARATAADLYELLLCTSHVSLEFHAGGTEGGGGGEEKNEFNLFPSLLRAEDLDRLVGRHPISLLAHVMMVNELVAHRTAPWPSVFPPRDEVISRHRNALSPVLGGACSPDSLLRVVEKETRELESLLEHLERRRLLILRQSLQSNMPADSSMVNLLTGLSTILLDPSRHPATLIESVSTTESWDFHFPLFMYPVLHLGRVSPKESFYKLLMRERALGIDGLYTRLDRLDHKIHIMARRLVCNLRQRVHVYRYFKQLAAEFMLLDQQRKMMIYEDARSTIVEIEHQRLEAEAARRRYERTCLYALERLFCCCCCCCPALPRAKVYARDEASASISGARSDHLTSGASSEDRQKQAFLFLRKYNPHNYNPSDAKLTHLMRSILRTVYAHNFDFTHEVVRRHLHSIEAFRNLDVPALQSQLASLRRASEEDHSRSVSWTTGEKVYVNSRGEHIDPKAAIFPKLAYMSVKYSALSVTGGAAKGTEDVKGESASAGGLLRTASLESVGFESVRRVQSWGSAKSVKSIKSVKSATSSAMPVDPYLDPDDPRRAMDSSAPASSTPQASTGLGCEEFLLGGGLQSMFVVLRVLEDEQINSRGVAIYENIQADQFAAFLSRDTENAQLLYPCARDDAGLTVGLALRSGFSYHPLCSVCGARYAVSMSSRGTFLCDMPACVSSGPVSMLPLPSVHVLRRQMASIVLRKRYAELSTKHLACLARIQAIVRAKRVRRKYRKLLAKLGINSNNKRP